MTYEVMIDKETLIKITADQVVKDGLDVYFFVGEEAVAGYTSTSIIGWRKL